MSQGEASGGESSGVRQERGRSGQGIQQTLWPSEGTGPAIHQSNTGILPNQPIKYGYKYY